MLFRLLPFVFSGQYFDLSHFALISMQDEKSKSIHPVCIESSLLRVSNCMQKHQTMVSCEFVMDDQADQRASRYIYNRLDRSLLRVSPYIQSLLDSNLL